MMYSPLSLPCSSVNTEDPLLHHQLTITLLTTCQTMLNTPVIIDSVNIIVKRFSAPLTDSPGG